MKWVCFFNNHNKTYQNRLTALLIREILCSVLVSIYTVWKYIPLFDSNEESLVRLIRCRKCCPLGFSSYIGQTTVQFISSQHIMDLTWQVHDFPVDWADVNSVFIGPLPKLICWIVIFVMKFLFHSMKIVLLYTSMCKLYQMNKSDLLAYILWHLKSNSLCK